MAQAYDAVVARLGSVVAFLPYRSIVIPRYLVFQEPTTAIVHEATHVVQEFYWDVLRMLAFFHTHVQPRIKSRFGNLSRFDELLQQKLPSLFSNSLDPSYNRFIYDEAQKTNGMDAYIFLAFLNYWRYLGEFQAHWCHFCYSGNYTDIQMSHPSVLPMVHNHIRDNYLPNGVIMQPFFDVFDPTEAMHVIQDLENHPRDLMYSEVPKNP